MATKAELAKADAFVAKKTLKKNVNFCTFLYKKRTFLNIFAQKARIFTNF